MEGDSTMPTFAEMMTEADERGLIRKVRRALGFLAPLDVALPETLTDATSQPVDLKALGFKPIGIVSPDGWRFARDVTKEDVDALGYASPVRSDITRVARQVTVNPLEFGRRHVTELKYGVDLSGVTQDATSGEVVWDEPDLPVNAEYRLLVIADDGAAADNWIMGKGLPRVKIADSSEETWGGEGAVAGDITLDIFTDDELGTPVRHYLGGTGAKASADVLGFTAAP